jgi:hypothetical protein
MGAANECMMAMRRIHTIRELDEEIRRGRRRAADIERELGGNLAHLKDNYPMMALRSVLGSGFVRSRTGTVGVLLLRLLGNERLQEGLMTLLDKLGRRVGRAFGRFRGGEKTPAGDGSGGADGGSV